MSSLGQEQKSQLQGSEEEDAAAFLQAMQVGTFMAAPMALKAILELGVIEIIAAAGPGKQISAAQIASKIPTGNPHAADVLDRMLRLLASSGLVKCSLAEAGRNGRMERLYGLAPVSKFLRRDENGTSIASLVLLENEKVFYDSWQELKSTVLEEAFVPFNKVHGKRLFEYAGTDPRFNSAFNQAMSSLSNLLINKLLDTYTGFHGLDELVDVGGGIGSTLRLVVSKFPHINGINFDLPHVIANAPRIPGVEHVGGDMFASLPSAKAFFMKWILHDWNDEQCVTLLKNCFAALPASGKVIVIDYAVPVLPEPDVGAQVMFAADICMMAHTGDGRERSTKEFEKLAKDAGFSALTIACSVYIFSVMELHK